MNRRRTANQPTEKSLAGAHATRCLALTSALLAAGCGGEVPVRVMLPQQMIREPAVPGPGVPHVHITVDPRWASPDVELHELVGLDRVPYSIQGRYGSASGTTETVVGRPVCAPPCEVVVDGRRGQEFFFAGAGISESPRFRLDGEAGKLLFTVRPGHSAVRAVGVPLTGIGGAGVVVGGVLMAVTAGIAASTGGNGNYTLGGGVLGAGSALLGVGIAMLLSGRTTYTLTRE